MAAASKGLLKWKDLAFKVGDNLGIMLIYVGYSINSKAIGIRYDQMKSSLSWDVLLEKRCKKLKNAGLYRKSGG